MRAFHKPGTGLDIEVLRIAEPGFEFMRAVTDERIADHGFYMGKIAGIAKLFSHKGQKSSRSCRSEGMRARAVSTFDRSRSAARIPGSS